MFSKTILPTIQRLAWPITAIWFFWAVLTTTAVFLALASLTNFLPLLAPTNGLLLQLNWLADLLSQTRLHLFGLLFLSTPVFIVGQRYWQAGLTAVFALLNFVSFNALYLPTAIALGETPTYQAIMLNVQSSGEHYDEVLAFLQQTKPDIVVLTEMRKAWPAELTPLLAAYPYSNHHQAEQFDGTVVYSRFPLSKNGRFHPLHFHPDDRAAAFVQLNIDGQDVTILAAHPRSPRAADRIALRNNQLLALGQLVAQQTVPTLLIGDLNTTPWSPVFQELLAISGLKNGRLGFGAQPTWPASLGNLGIPIDHVLVTPDIQIRQLHAGPNIGSDHAPLLVEFSLNKEPSR